MLSLFPGTVGGRELRHLGKLFRAQLPLLCHAGSCRQGLKDEVLPGLPGKVCGLISSPQQVGVVPEAAAVPELGDSKLLFTGSSHVSMKLQEAKPNKD